MGMFGLVTQPFKNAAAIAAVKHKFGVKLYAQYLFFAVFYGLDDVHAFARCALKTRAQFFDTLGMKAVYLHVVMAKKLMN